MMTPEEFAKRMQQIADSDSPEDGHIEADELMCFVLRKLGYEDGVDIFDAMEKMAGGAVQMSEWIKTSERLPDAEYGEGKNVLTVNTLEVIRVAYYDGSCWCNPDGEPVKTARLFPITHWMPIPEPPEEEDHDDV